MTVERDEVYIGAKNATSPKTKNSVPDAGEGGKVPVVGIKDRTGRKVKALKVRKHGRANASLDYS